MKVNEIIKELSETDSFKEFKSKYPNSFFTAGFFILSSEEKEGDKIQIDFYVKELQKFCSFEYPFNSFKLHDDIIENANNLSNLDYNLDLGDLSDFIQEKTGNKFKKIIAIIQNDEWNITCMDGINIQRIKIDPFSSEVKTSESLGMNDLFRFKA